MQAKEEGSHQFADEETKNEISNLKAAKGQVELRYKPKPPDSKPLVPSNLSHFLSIKVKGEENHPLFQLG